MACNVWQVLDSFQVQPVEVSSNVEAICALERAAHQLFEFDAATSGKDAI